MFYTVLYLLFYSILFVSISRTYFNCYYCQVCKGDMVVIDVVNKMKGRSTTIHWHGILQRGTPFMDGVPMVTQCPIVDGQTFRYSFLAEDPGTYFWHSHDGMTFVL